MIGPGWWDKLKPGHLPTINNIRSNWSHTTSLKSNSLVAATRAGFWPVQFLAIFPQI